MTFLRQQRFLTLLLSVLVVEHTAAIRPSSTPRMARKIFRQRPSFRRGYRRLDEGTEDVTKGRRIPPLDQLRYVDNTSDSTLSKEELAKELSSLMEGIETLAHEVEETQSIPPSAPDSSKTDDSIESAGSRRSRLKKSNEKPPILNVHELRQAVLDEGMELKEVQLDPEQTQLLVNATAEELLDHDVIELIAKRFKTGSTPGNRAPRGHR
jgi:hypothetical protein